MNQVVLPALSGLLSPGLRGGVAIRVVGLLALTAASPGATSAQAARADTVTRIEITTSIDTSRHIPARSEVEFSLSRALTPDDGEIGMLVGGVDVSALIDWRGQRLVYRPTVVPLPAGDTEIVVYLKHGSNWTELRRVPLKVLTAAGFTRVSFAPTSTLGNKGQLVEGRSQGVPEPDRATFQDFVFNLSLNTAHEAPRFTLETSSNYVGVSRREEALRFSERESQAPLFDLSDYKVTLRAGGGAVTVGHTTFGASRHLVSGFASRGATMEWSRGGTQVTFGALNAAPTVGWDNLVGIDRSRNRVMGAVMGQELYPRRPGAFRVDATLLDASRLPVNGFTQGAVLDAETNAGGSLQISAATPGQRVRLTGGYARSRFDNPARDGELTGDTIVRAVERETRGARFVEANASPVQNVDLPGVGAVNVGLGWRHERIDPLYRSVTAPVQADRQQDAAEATLALGPISGQLGWSRSRDNLGRLSTILTTLGDIGTANVAVPLAQVLRIGRGKSAVPTLTFSYNRTHQRADGVPAGNLFRPQDVPDQLSLISDWGAQWQLGRWRVVARRNRSQQDNRQPLRENVDFSAGADALSVGAEFGASADVSLDVGKDFQRSEQRSDQTDVRRFTLNVNLRRGQSTSVVMAASLMRTQPPTGPSSVNGEQRMELTQPLTFFREASGGARGQVFLRFGRTTSLLPDLAQQVDNPLALESRRQWALASGLNLRVF